VHHNLIMPTLINTRSGERLRRVMPAASGSGALVAAFLAKHYGGHETDGARMSVPLSTITARDHHTLVYAFLVKYYATKDDPNLKAPMHRVSTEDGVALVTIKGERYRIADIGMRHLTPRELYRAQSFSDGYIIDPPFNGKPMTKTAQVRMCGNSVPPVVAQALVQANLPLRAAG
jgi:DNA (cytosine-5)-methyltransferase 1